MISTTLFNPAISFVRKDLTRYWRVDYSYREGSYIERTLSTVRRTWETYTIYQNGAEMAWSGPHYFEETWDEGWRAYITPEFSSQFENSAPGEDEKITVWKELIETGKFSILMGIPYESGSGKYTYYDWEYSARRPAYPGEPIEEPLYRIFSTMSEADEEALPAEIEEWWIAFQESFASSGRSDFQKSAHYEVDENGNPI